MPQEILTEDNNIKGSNLRDLLPSGFGLHHCAGIPQEECSLVMELFANGSFQVLMCAATLAKWYVKYFFALHSQANFTSRVYSCH